ncbi:MAG: septum formation initiator family protein [Acidobacteriota bacterium]|jgi:cell division protein FtsB|nr:MAG: hypothetical protein DIU54_04980 [Acidobacteriota bacterium]
MAQQSTTTAREDRRVRVRPGVAAEARRRRRRVITWLLIGGAGVLVINSIVGENGYLATLRLRRTEAVLMQELARLRIENRELQAERERLESDPDALEEAVRAELGYIRPGETAVVVREIRPLPDAPSP